jgi:O-antigen ligase
LSAESSKLSSSPPATRQLTGRRSRRQWRLTAADIQLHEFFDTLTEGLIYASLVFAPWAFGSTQPWSIWSMNVAGFALGVLLLGKTVIRKFKGYDAPQWFKPGGYAKQLTRGLAVFTVVLLGYCCINAVNARSTYTDYTLSFDYHEHLKWLPSSFDSRRSWQCLWNYSAIACYFWATWNWLRGKSKAEQFAERRVSASGQLTRVAVAGAQESGAVLPTRLRRLMWVIAVNAGLLGLESMLQRMTGSTKLLFLVQPRVNPGGESQFGPYAYRANAASYFNLVWPVCVGFWWTLARGDGFRKLRPYILLLCAIVAAACPTISTSRGGALISAGLGAVALVFLLVAEFVFSKGKLGARWFRPSLMLLICVIGTLALAYALGGKALGPRMEEFGAGFTGREEMYERARPMAEDYPIFGTGPGTFEAVFQLYRISTSTYWPAQLHNDWLETRITFGWFGSALIASAFILVLARWFAGGGIHGPRRFTGLLWIAMLGILVHARWDFPFQIYSILHLFIILCAILFASSRRP